MLSRSDGMADVADSKSVGGDTVWVQVPSTALEKQKPFGFCFFAHFISELHSRLIFYLSVKQMLVM